MSETTIPVAAPETPPPKKRHHRVRNTILVGVGGLAALAVAVSAAGGGGSGPAAHPSSPPPSTAVTVPSTPPPPPAPPPPAPAAPSLAEKMTAWLGGQGYESMTAVQQDITRLSEDAGAQDVAAVADDGKMLKADATVAGRYPPPVGADHYSAAMRHFSRAGGLAQAGDYAGAALQLQAATADLNKTTAEINAVPGSERI